MASTIAIPRRLPLLVVADNVLLPGSSMRIPVRNMKNMNMVKSRLMSRSTLSSTIIGVIPQESKDDQDDDLSTLHPIGTAAVVVQVTGTNWPRPSYTLLVTGLCRFKMETLLQETPYIVASVTQLDKLTDDFEEIAKKNGDLDILADNFREQAAKLVDMLDISIPVVAKLKKMLESLPSQHLPDICAAIVKASYAEKIQVLDAVDLNERFKKALPLLMRQIEGLKLLQKARKDRVGGVEIVTRKKGDLFGRSGGMKRALNKIPSDLDDDDDADSDEINDLEQKIKSARMPEHALKASMKEIKRLKKMPQQMPEHAMIRNYLELMSELPWSKSSKDILDIEQARRDLDVDHYGLEKVKKRLLEYLAVRQLKNSLKGPILCFVGPPGVGKTSIGRSIAQTLGREFHRISLGGVCDQSDIRGHRRTYIGSLPGRIIHGLRLVGTNNPVFLLDEVDKLGKSLHGDPASALLEVLDPEQNHAFTDHYLNVPFDLSQVLFIATANNMATIPPPLLDRMELIQIPGYTQEEKANIAIRHLIPKQFKEHGLSAEQLQIPEDSTKLIISKYTREAGVRSLERRIGAVCRAVAVKVAENMSKSKHEKQEATKADDKKQLLNESLPENLSQDATTMAHPPEMPIVVDEAAIKDILGPPQFESEVSQRLVQPGVAVGLAWTVMGGEIMFVEATRMDGEGKVILTGQLGDVMKESANLAMNWVRANSKKLQIGNGKSLLSGKDVHIHFPAGAVGKDGPSAGVTIATVLVSLFSGRLVRSDTAMTGEITLRGLVLPVGGIKEKVLAAHRAGIRRVILPKRNTKDLHEIPSNVKVLLAFYEKEVPFKPKLVSLFSGQHNSPWYVKLNPGVHVPVLQDDETIITEPDQIIKYIDSSFPAEGPLLVPEDDSQLGQKVASLQKKLDSIEMDVITYGIIYHPHLSESGCKIPGATQRSMRENFAKRLSVLTQLAAKHPALRDAYLTKSQTAAQKFDIITDAVQVQKHLEELKATINEVENQLKTIKESNKDFEDNLWLFGPMYTAADISLTALLNRFALLGLESLYFPTDKCPYINDYYRRVQKRPSFIKLQKECSNIRLTLVWENIKMVSPYVAGVASICMIGGVGYWAYQKYK